MTTGMATMMALSPSRREARMRDGIEAFKAYMAPVHALRAQVLAISFPTIIVHADGRTEQRLSPWTLERLAEIEKVEKQIFDGFPWDAYGLARPDQL